MRIGLNVLLAAFLLSIVACAAGSAADHMWLGDSNAKQGNWDAAITEYQKAIDLKADIPEANMKLATAYNNRALTRIDNKDFTGALDDLNKAIQLDPKLAEAYNNRGWANNGAGNYDQSIEDLNMAMQLGFDSTLVS